MKYLVNIETKEHLNFDKVHPWFNSVGWKVVEADADGWIPWGGGECPVPADTECHVHFEDGFKKADRFPEGWEWRRAIDEVAIIAYRPVLAEKEVAQTKVTAASILKSALGHMEDRAATYDKPSGERSMGKTVQMFNTLTGKELTEEQGWLFMTCLKLARSQQGDYRADSYEDGAAYFALGGEIAAKERGCDRRLAK